MRAKDTAEPSTGAGFSQEGATGQGPSDEGAKGEGADSRRKESGDLRWKEFIQRVTGERKRTWAEAEALLAQYLDALRGEARPAGKAFLQIYLGKFGIQRFKYWNKMFAVFLKPRITYVSSEEGVCCY